MSDITGIGIKTPITATEIQTMDVEYVLMALQSERVQNLDATLKQKMDAMRVKNEDLTKLNNASAILSKLNVKDPPDHPEGGLALDFNATKSLTDAGFTPKSPTVTEGEVAAWKTDVKTKIENANNSQQMEMLELQTINNRRNEAFEIMTNFAKKQSESRSGIIRNM